MNPPPPDPRQYDSPFGVQRATVMPSQPIPSGFVPPPAVVPGLAPAPYQPALYPPQTQTGYYPPPPTANAILLPGAMGAYAQVPPPAYGYSPVPQVPYGAQVPFNSTAAGTLLTSAPYEAYGTRAAIARGYAEGYSEGLHRRHHHHRRKCPF